MKVKVISRNPDEYIRETKSDIHKVQRNYDPSLHPLESAREYSAGIPIRKMWATWRSDTFDRCSPQIIFEIIFQANTCVR